MGRLRGVNINREVVYKAGTLCREGGIKDKKVLEMEGKKGRRGRITLRIQVDGGKKRERNFGQQGGRGG